MYYNGEVKLKDLVDTLEQHMIESGEWTVHKFARDITPPINSHNVLPDGQQLIDGGCYSNQYGYYAFNHKQDNYWRTNAPEQFQTWDFGEDNAKLIDRVGIVNYQQTSKYSAKRIRVEASNDNIDYVPLGDFDNINLDDDTSKGGNIGAGFLNNKKIFKLNNTEAFRFYKIVVAELYSICCDISSIELLPPNEEATEFDYVFTSPGTSGEDNLVVFFRRGSTELELGNSFRVGIAESFDSVNYGMTKQKVEEYYTSANANKYYNYTDILITYEIDINKDRVFLATTLDPGAKAPAVNCVYAGLMKRHSPETDSGATMLVMGQAAPTSNPYVMRSLSKVLYKTYTNKYMVHNHAPSSWGGNIFVSPIFLEGDFEGIRGEYDGVYCARPEGIVNGDKVTIGSSEYRAIVLTSYGNNQFPTQCVLFKLPAVTETQPV